MPIIIHHHYNTVKHSMKVFGPLCQRTRYYGQILLPALPATSSLPVMSPFRLNPRQIRSHLDTIVIGQESMKKALSVAIYNHYIRIDQQLVEQQHVSNNLHVGYGFGRKHTRQNTPTMIEKSNILLIGPTGSGKTLISKAIAELLNVPFSMNDAAPFTQAGYVGEDVESCIYRLLQNASFDVVKAQQGIVFIDEIDKIARRSDSSNPNQRDVSGEGVQQGLLRILEGTTVNITVKPGAQGRKPGGAGSNVTEVFTVDTSNILFICSGAFVGLDKIITERTAIKKSIGFDAPVTMDNNISTEKMLSQCEPRDLVKFGFIPEFVGRLPVLANATELKTEELVRILTEPKNAIVAQYQSLFRASQMDLRLTSAALHRIADESLKKKTGARGLRRIMENLLQDALYEFPGTHIHYVVVHLNHLNDIVVSGFHAGQIEKANKVLDGDQAPFQRSLSRYDFSKDGYKPIIRYEDEVVNLTSPVGTSSSSALSAIGNISMKIKNK